MHIHVFLHIFLNRCTVSTAPDTHCRRPSGSTQDASPQPTLQLRTSSRHHAGAPQSKPWTEQVMMTVIK